MKIILIQQAGTDMQWSARYDAAGFERAVQEERTHAAVPPDCRKGDASAYRVYTGTAPASVQTAELLFDLSAPPAATELLDDVPLRAFRAGGGSLTRRVWQTAGSIQWAVGGGRQSETRAETLKRVRKFVTMLEKEERDCIVVSRGLTMAALKTVLRGRGYCLEGGGPVPKPLERVRATKQSLHCGGCAHNCLLSEAKCDTGKNKARGIR